MLVEALVATSQLDLAYKVDHALAEKHEIAAYGSSTAEQYPVQEKQMNTLSGRSRSGDRGKPDAYSGGHQSNYETDHGLSAPVRQTTTDHSHQETERILDFHGKSQCSALNPQCAGINFSRQNLTSKLNPHTVRIKIFVLVVNP